MGQTWPEANQYVTQGEHRVSHKHYRQNTNSLGTDNYNQVYEEELGSQDLKTQLPSKPWLQAITNTAKHIPGSREGTMFLLPILGPREEGALPEPWVKDPG